MAQVERMTLEMDVIAKVDGAIGGINKIKNTLQGIKMPPKLSADLEKSFSNLSGLFERYKDQVKNGFNTKGDVSSFAKTAKQIDNEVDRLSRNLHKLTGEKLSLNIETDKLKTAQGELTKLIAQKEKLMSDIKGSFGLDNYFKAFKDSSVGRRGTKINDAANVMQTSLQRGDLLKALEDVKTLEAEYNRMSQIRKDAFAKLTGVSGDTAIQQLKTNLQTVVQETNRLDNSIKTTTQDLENLPNQMMNEAGQLAQQAASSMDRLATETKQVTASSTEAARASQSMSQQLQDLQSSTQYFFSLRNMINLLKRGIDDAVQSVKELDAAMTETAVVTDYKVSDLWGMLPQYTQIANELGATTQGAYETMTLYFQQGLNQQQAFEIGAETMKMARIAGLEYAEATDMMTAALRGFNMELNDISAQRINDVYSKLAAVTASDTEELGTAMQRTASIAHSAGMSFEGTTAFLAQAIETTREPAENLGTAMKTIVARFQEMKKNPLEITEVEGEEVSYNKVDEALQSIGVSLKDTNGQFRELDQVFLDISSKWDSLSQTQQRYIATIAAGSRQQSRFIAMMSNYGRTMELMEAANNSAGASEEQFGKTMDSLEAKLNKLHNAWQQFTMGIANNSMIKGAVDGMTGILTVVNKLIDGISLGIGPVKSLLSLLTAFTGLKMAGRFANSIIGGLGGLIDPQSSFGKGFKGGILGTKQGTNMAQAQAISNPIVQAIHQLQGAITKQPVPNGQSDNVSDIKRTSASLFKDTNKAIREALSSDKLTGSGLIQHLSGLDKSSQRLMMANLTGTQKNLNQNLLGQYGNSIFKKSLPTIQTAFKRIDEKVANESIAFTEGYAAKISPKALLKHLDMDNADERELAQSIGTALKNARDEALTQAVKDRAKKQGRVLEDSELEGAIRAFRKTDEGKRIAEEATNKPLEDPTILRTPMQEAMDSLGKFGSGLTGAGMAISTFGNALTATGIPGIEQLGTVLSTIGSGIMSLGTMLSGAAMAVTAFTEAAAESAVVQKMTSFLTNPITIVVAAIAAALAALVVAIKLHNKKIKEEAEKVTTDYTDKTSKAKENINNLKQYREELASLSSGVDENGLNVSLDTEDYERYREIVNSIAEINPSIVKGYNAQGDAIIDNNSALEETLRLQEEINQQATEEYINPYSLDKLIKARDLDEAFNDPTAKKTGQDSDPARQAAKHLISVMKKSNVQDEFLEQFDLTYDQLAKDENNAINRFIANHDVMMRSLQNRYKATGRELNSSLVEGFGNLSEAYDAQQEAIKPIYDNLLAYASNKQLTKGFEPEMISAFNQGIKTIAGSKATGADMQGAVDKYAKLMNNLIGKNSEYNKIMKDVTDLQKEWTNDLNDDAYNNAVQEKSEALKDLADKERETAESAEEMSEAEREAHRVMADFYDNSAAKVLNFTNKSIQDLTSTFNEFSESIRNAGQAYEDYQKRIEGIDNYGTGVNSFKQIYDDIFKETEDSSGRKQQLNIEGIGRPEAWEAAKSFFTSDWLSGKSINEVVDGLKQIGPLLEEGQQGAVAFGDKIRDSLLNDKDFKDRFGEIFNLNPEDGSVNIAENIAPEMMEHLARYWGIQEDLLVAWFDNARQYMPDFTFGSSNEEIRNALAKDSRTYHGPQEATGDKEALFVRKDTLVDAFEAGGTYAQDVIDDRITDLGKEQSVYAIPELDKDFKLSKEDRDYMTDTMGINKDNFVDSLAPLLTGEEMEQYASQLFDNGAQWWQSEGEELYNTWSANQEGLIDDLTPQEGDELPSIASSVSNIESMMTADLYRSGQMEDTSSLDQMHRAIFGNEGWDTSVQKLKHGANIDMSKEEFDQYYAEASEAVATLSKAEADLNAGRLQAVKDYGESSEQVAKYDKAIQQVQSDLKYAKGAIDEADKYVQTKQWNEPEPPTTSTSTTDFNTDIAKQQLTTMMNQGFTDLFSSIDPNMVSTPEISQAISTIYDSFLNNKFTEIDDKVTEAFNTLGIDIDKAAENGLLTPTETAREKAQKAAQENAVAAAMEKEEEPEVDSSVFAGYALPAMKALFDSAKEGITTAVQQASDETDTNIPEPSETSKTQPSIAPMIQDTGKVVQQVAFETIGKEETEGAIQSVKDSANEGAELDVKAKADSSIQKTLQAVQGLKKASAGSNTANVGAKVGGQNDITNLSTAIGNVKSKTVNITANVNGLSTVRNLASEIKNLKDKTITITTKKVNTGPTGYTGLSNKISYHHVPDAGSAAGGTKKGRIGPRNQGGMTLTGELGYEIAWLPSENRSVILGANGPQMVNLPKDATVYNHDQSKEIMKKRQGIPAGSMWGGGSIPTSVSTGNGSGSGSGTLAKKVGDNSDKVAKKAESTAEKIVRVTVWWENIARATQDTQRKMDNAAKSFENYTKELRATLKKTGESTASGGGGGDDYIKQIEQYIGLNKTQVQRATDELNQLNSSGIKGKKTQKKLKKAYQADNAAVTQISYTKGKKGKTKNEFVDLSSYITVDKATGAYQIDEKKIKGIKNADKRKAVVDAANKELNDRITKRNTAQDNWQKAEEALKKMGEELYKTFFEWKTELTKIWNITQQIEKTEANISRNKGYADLLKAQLSSGFEKAFDVDSITGELSESAKAFNNKTLESFKLGIDQQRTQIEQELKSLDLKKSNLSNLLNITDDWNKLKAVQDKLRGTSINDTERAGYDKYETELIDSIKAQQAAFKYMTVNQNNLDGTISIDFKTDLLEQDQQNGEITADFGKKIEEYVKSVQDASKDIASTYESITSHMADMYSALSTLKDEWAGYANELWQVSDEASKKEADNLKKLSDSLNKALKNLLDDVKRKLDERRKQEDNAKTERDISQKQQRLAALQADTSGGNQVEIAQLQQEIAQAQQDYQRTLEDQLLDRLQQQADLAAQQREQQIALQEGTLEAINNAALVNAWMNEPEKYRQEIYEAYMTANEADTKPDALREQLELKFQELFNGLVTNKDEQAKVTETIQGLTDQQKVLDKIQESIDALKSNAPQTQINNSSSSGGGGQPVPQKANTPTTPTAPAPAAKPTAPSLPYGKVVKDTNDKTPNGSKKTKAVQYALNQLMGAGLKVDGNFGPKTIAAVKKFQKKYGLTVDGRVGPKTAAKFNSMGYKTGGLADYTGPAWLDGTPSKPELVLNSTDTKNFIALKDVLSKVMGSTNAIENTYGGDTTFEININVDHLNNDYDVDKVAERVKKIIVKDSSYRNVTQVRNFR